MATTWKSIIGKPNFATVAISGLYTDLKNIPVAFAPELHMHDSLYLSKSYKPTWEEITNKMEQKALTEALIELSIFGRQKLTTSQIDALIPIEDMEVYDLTLHVRKYWNGTIWKTIKTD